MTSFKVNIGAGWVTAAPYRWDGSAWREVGGSGSVTPTDPPAGPLYRQIATRTGVSTFPMNTVSSITSKTDRVRHVVTLSGTDPTISFNNVQGTGAGLGPVTYAAAIEIDGAVRQFTFSGAARVTLQPGEAVTSDPLTGITVPTGNVYTRTYISVPTATDKFPQSWGVYLFGANGEGTTRLSTGADLTTSGSGSIGAGSTAGMPPLALSAVVASTVTKPALAIVGDSISQSEQDDYQSDPTHSAAAVRAASAAGIPYINYARGGDKAQLMNNAARQAYWFEALETCTHAVCGYAINDFAGARTLAQLQADNLAIWNYLGGRGLKVAQVTCTPYTSSTDSFATTTNQTAFMTTKEADRLAWNAWLLDGAPLVGGSPAATGTPGALRAGSAGHPLVATINTAATVETSGKWNVGTTTEGLHPNPAGHALMAVPIKAWLDTL